MLEVDVFAIFAFVNGFNFDNIETDFPALECNYSYDIYHGNW